MSQLRVLLRTSFVLVLILITAAMAIPAREARAQGPDSSQDGRITQGLWANQFGAIAVYCLGANKDNSDTNYLMAIEVLYGDGPDRSMIGNTLFWARFPKIDSALKLAKSGHQNVEIDRNETKYKYGEGFQIVTWSLWARPDGQFEVTTLDGLTLTTQTVVVWRGCEGPKNLSLPPLED